MKPEIEPQSNTWKAVEEYATEKLESYRKQNDSTDLDEVKTAVIRGRIAALKELLALSQAPATKTDDGDYRPW